MSALSIERAQHLATLWLDRPEARNAIGQEFFDELLSSMTELAGDSDVRAVVIAARGRDFSVGLDLKNPGPTVNELAGHGSDGRSLAVRAKALLHHVKRHQAAFTAVATCPKPVIAAVQGYCVGAGLDLIAACDIRVAAADAIFSVRETKRAIVADMGSLQRLPAIIGPGHFAEMVYTGKLVDARRAEKIGLVNDVYPDAETALAAARELAAEIAENSPLGVEGTKTVLLACEGRTVAEGTDYVALWQAAMLSSNDLQEAIAAFREKRSPRFTGT